MGAFPIRTVLFTSAAAAAAALFFVPADQAVAAKNDGCEGGGFVIRQLNDGTTVGDGVTNIPASNLGRVFLVDGKYIEFLVVSASFGIENYLFTGVANPQDITGGRRTPVWASKTPDHRGLVLTTAAEVDIDGPDLVIKRSGTGDLDMKIQAKDCATGGVFQMEPERGDHTETLFTHILANGVRADGSDRAFYFDNPNFRAREGELVPYKDIFIPVPSRINIANSFSRKFVARDSAQEATRLQEETCQNSIPRIRLGGVAIVKHCGGVSRWLVKSGGRMGFVTGQDAVEVAPGATDCIQDCQAQNQVRGQAVVLGFPFPVPANVKLQPRTPTPF